MNDAFGIYGALGAGFLALILFAVYCSGEDEKACAAKGGHRVHIYKSSLCVSADGRILD